jgi:5-methylcytosine-specific restriction enzyme subunit McrC
MRHYRFILNVCELIHTESLATTEAGDVFFRDFDRNEAIMGVLFEEFVRNFYDKEQNLYRVSSPRVQWDLDPALSTSCGIDLLPAMRSDICLDSVEDKMIIDCKFYADAFQHHYDKRKFVSQNLYQIFCYLKNQSVKPGWQSVRGMLLYPTTDEQIDEMVHIQGHEIRIATINLAQDWTCVSQDLLNLLQRPRVSSN